MRNKFLISFFIILTNVICSQTTFFIKYKDSVPAEKVSEVVANKIFPANSKLALNKSADISVNYFAKSIGKNIQALSRIIKVRTNTTLSDSDLDNILKSSPDIEYVQRSHTYKIDFVPNDEYYTKQWALEKIHAMEAWNITQGSDSVLIALIDTGIDYLHPDLKNKIYCNSSEDINHNGVLDAGDINGIDDDGNGFVDDVIGWDFTDHQGFPFDSTGGDYLQRDNNPMDDNGHGTSVAGIIAAETNNNIGIAGTAPGIKVLNVRAFDPAGNGEEDDVAAAILYAVLMKARVINMSFGDDSFSLVLKDVVKYAYSQNVVLVGSAGNSSSQLPHYPSSYSEVISVGASTKEDYVASFSNTGSTIDLVAPGSEVLTTSLNNKYAESNGTSLAAPFVSAASGLLLSLKSMLPEEVKQILKSTSDDIYPTGWDLQSGAGRLNIFNALNVLAPAKIKFIYPAQDFSTNKDTLNISASVLSPYFLNYELSYGIGYNPDKWNILLGDQKYQVADKELYKLNLSGLSDTVYTLRLVVSLNNGRTTEERVNFYLDHTPPQMGLISLSEAYYGDKSTILAEVTTDDPSFIKMYYRVKGSSEFSYVTLDGFNTNNEFIKKHHYGFIPKDIVLSNTEYEIYFDAVNLVGLHAILKNGNDFFIVKTDDYFNLTAEYKQNFSLPAGLLFKDAVNFTNSNYKEVILQESGVSNYPTKFYRFENDSFVKIDSMVNRFPKDFGDFNSNGKYDLLSSLSRTGYIDEQKSAGSTKLVNKWVDTSGAFFPILARDIDKDGKVEILSIMKDKSLAVWQVNDDLKLSLESTLNNFSVNDPLSNAGNTFGFSNATIVHNDESGKDEIWMVDQDGDIMNFIINGTNSYSNGSVIETDYISDYSLISSGDFNGDKKSEIAVLLHSSENYSIASYNMLIVFNILNGKMNVVYEKKFLDPSANFKSTFQSAESSIRFSDIDNDNNEELILFAYPYSYIIKYYDGNDKIIVYKENINSNSIFIGDINSDGVKEIGYPTSAGINFYEYSIPNKPAIPTELVGYSTNNSSAFISWKGSAERYLIYKGTDSKNIKLYDSTSLTNYIDKLVDDKKYYYYQIVAYNSMSVSKYSNLSRIIPVFIHQPARVIHVESKNAGSLLVEFDNKIDQTVENISCFEIIGKGNPNSITAASQYSYLISFGEQLPGTNKMVIKGISDFYGSPIPGDTISFTINTTSQSSEFYISSFELLSPNRIKITFNLDVDPISAKNTKNYSFQPENKVEEIEVVPDDKKSLIISTDYPVGSIGKEYRLKINELYSSEISGRIEINKESGSYLVLSSYANNLDNMFVYPNPAKLNTNNKITFASLTKNASIVIINLSGKKIRTLVENNGDGGIDWDLKDESGEIVGSGVYIYRVTTIDDENNEGQVKLGKFAIVK